MAYGSLPPQTDPYLRQMLETMLGRRGQVGDKLVTLDELATLLGEAGIAEGVNLTLPSNPEQNIIDLLNPKPVLTDPGVAPATVAEPETPQGLTTLGVLGAVLLTWDGATYEGHSHTQVWRAQVDDVTQAQMVHHEPLNRYTDITGNTLPHYYWLKHVNRDGLTSDFQSVAGVVGAGTLSMGVADLILEHPEIAVQPFTVINQGSEDQPEWVLALNGDVAVNGAVNISQLASGELQDGVALSVGQGSLVIGTNSEGRGVITLAGPGGVQGNDYMVFDSGRIYSYVYQDGVGHVPYKEVKRMESGTANSGQQVTIPAYFRSQPTIHLYPRDVSVYNAEYATQSQRLEISHSEPQPHSTIAGAWTFTPVARLLLAASSQTLSPNWFASTPGDSSQWELSGQNGIGRITLSVRMRSVKSLGGVNFQNRQVRVQLSMRSSSAASWLLMAEQTVNVYQDGVSALTLAADLPITNQQDIRVLFLGQDRAGTYTSGAPTYDYDNRSQTGTGFTLTTTAAYANSAKSASRYLSIGTPALVSSGWQVTKINYTATFDITLKVRSLYTNRFGDIVAGKASVDVPDGKGGTQTFSAESNPASVDYWALWETTIHENQQVTWTDASYLDGNIRGIARTKAQGAGYTNTSLSNYMAGAEAILTVKSVTATVYYQRVSSSGGYISSDFYVDSYTVDRGATDISIDNAVLTWTATSSE